MSFAVDVQDVKDYRDLLPAPGKYQAEIIKATEGMTSKDRPKIDLRLKILDTIPAGEEIDEDEYENPLESIQFATIYLVKDDDPKRTQSFMTSMLRDWLVNFEIEPEVEGELSASDFVSTVGGCIIKHEKRDRNDPNSSIVSRVDKSCVLD